MMQASQPKPQFRLACRSAEPRQRGARASYLLVRRSDRIRLIRIVPRERAREELVVGGLASLARPLPYILCLCHQRFATMATKLSLKHITAITFNLPHLSTSSGVRSARLLLAGLPSVPTPRSPAVPEVVVKTTSGPSSIELTYSNKKTMKVDTDKSIKFDELLRKVRPLVFAPARGVTTDKFDLLLHLDE